jgi:hypothetical protein
MNADYYDDSIKRIIADMRALMGVPATSFESLTEVFRKAGALYIDMNMAIWNAIPEEHTHRPKDGDVAVSFEVAEIMRFHLAMEKLLR